MKNTVILYHAGCSDGFTAAWVAWKKFGDTAEYRPIHYQDPAPRDIVGKRVYLIDFAVSLPVLKEILKNNREVTIIDHHATGKEAAEMTQKPLFDNSHSGAVLAWKYFFPDQKIPQLCLYIEDRDLFQFKMKNTKEICAFLDLTDLNFKNWDRLAGEMESDKKLNNMSEQGSLIVRYENRMMKEIVEDTARLVTFEGHRTYAVNAPHLYASGVCEVLYKKLPPMSISWSYDKDVVIVSLRSDGSVDVGQMAKRYGGGGHKQAAGFEVKTLNEIPWKEV